MAIVTADTPLSQLPAATLPLTGAELVPMVQSGDTVNAAAAAIATTPQLQNIQNASYQFVLSDIGKEVKHALGAGAGHTYTIPANSTLALPVGGSITVINRDANNLSIAIGGTDVLTLAGTLTVGTRTLAQNGYATLYKDSATTWLIFGFGVT